MPLAVSGLGSGINIDGLVSSLTAVAMQPLTALQTKKANIDAASSTISTLSSKLSTLKSAALALSSSTGFSSFAAASTDTAIVVSTTGGSAVGSFSVQVNALAQTQKTRSGSMASETDAFGESSTMTITDASGDKAFSILATDSLDDVATKISASGARVSASIMNDGNGFRLVVQGLDTGASNGFTMSGGPSTLAFTEYQSAQDASLTVDGLPVTSKTNQLTNVIAGVKLALTKTTTTPATVSVTTNATSLENKLGSFLYAYNDFVTNSHTAVGFGSAKAANPILAADSSVRNALHSLGALVGNLVPNTRSAYTTMGSIGMKSNADGTLAMDYTKLEAALTADPASVQRLFVTDTSTGATGVMSTLMSAVDSMVKSSSSPIAARIASLTAQSKQTDDSVTKMQERIQAYTASIKAKFNAMDSAVAKYNSMSSQLLASTKTNSA